MKSKNAKVNLLIKGLIIISLFVIIIPLRTVVAVDLYKNIAPRFTKVSGYTSGPVTGSEPANIFWKDKSPSSIESFYVNNGWRVVKGDTFSLKVDYVSGIAVRLHVRLDMASSLQAYVGGSLKTNWNGKTFVANNEYSPIFNFPLVTIEMPLKRDHFRIWDIGSDVMGVATYDKGWAGPLTSAILDLLNDPAVYLAICAITLIHPIPAFWAIVEILIAAGILERFAGVFNAGHIIDPDNPWRTAEKARDTWYDYSSSYTYQSFDRCNTYSWSLTGNTVEWDGTAYKCYESSGGGGGGGCVAKGTNILLVDGRHTKKVQNLKIGDWVLGYNTSSGETVPVKVTNVTKSIVPALLNINEGLLKTTILNQPIYMRNETYTGWIIDPIDLKICDEIFYVPTQKWIKVGCLESEVGKKFEVYDIVTDPLNVFVCNGILLDVKE